MSRKTPHRMCMGCGQMFPKQNLFRVVKNKDGQIFYDPIGKANGRGAYICSNIKCFDRSIKEKKFEKVFKQSIPDEVIKELKEKIFDS